MNEVKIFGDIVLSESLRSDRAKLIHHYLDSGDVPYFRLVECRSRDKIDTLVIEVSVEVSKHRLIDIKSKEKIAIVFNAERDCLPSFYPLRKDFPLDVVHVTISDEGSFPSLCLWDESFSELRGGLTPFSLLSRLKTWLEKTADGVLHQDDQPLEPVLQGVFGQVIIPADISEPDEKFVGFRSENAAGYSVIRFVREKQIRENGKRPGFLLATFQTPAITHRAVKYAPTNLQQLKELLSEIQFDLSDGLKTWAESVSNATQLADFYPVILIEIPKKRKDIGEVESSEWWAFTTVSKTVLDLGESLGAFTDARKYGIPAQAIMLGHNDSKENLEEFSIISLIVCRELTSGKLPKLSGYDFQTTLSITAIGAGTLGSKVIELAARCGFGRWRLIDRDIFLPHNAVRHVLGEDWSGKSKAFALRYFVNTLVPGEPVSQDLVVDVKEPSKLEEAFNEALSGIDLILDMSASVAVARQLNEHPSDRRRASLFLSPSGNDVVLLLESCDRTVSLWDLEADYYRALVIEPSLDGHLSDKDGRVRYGNGCRDLTSRISADQVSTLSGIALRQIIRRVKDENASAAIWRSDLQTGKVDAIELKTSLGLAITLKDWRIRWSSGLIESLVQQRIDNLPNETGGVLLGIVDFEHRVIVAAADIPAPEDSKKRPHFFERGVTGVSARLKDVEECSAGQLRYIGEWHSHPDGTEAYPSTEDEQVFGRLSKIFQQASEPYIMAIISSNQLFTRFGLNRESEESIFALPVMSSK